MFEKIPDELKLLPQWVCIKSDSKIPLDPKTGYRASSTDMTTWSDFNTAVSRIEQGYVSNIGFVFNNSGIVGIDIDTGFDDGLLSDISSDIIGKCESYTEKSRSGRGFHILVKGALPFMGKNNLKGVEIYQEARYFITTGDTFIYENIIENQQAIDYILDKYFDEYRESNGKAKSFKLYTPIWDNPYVNGRLRLRPTYPKIQIGSRNICLTSVAGAMHNIGYSKAQIYKELVHVNKEACTPPLELREIKSICNSIVGYKR
nr:MAG TPA: hypothetical protein [Herelleviridae sp.]